MNGIPLDLQAPQITQERVELLLNWITNPDIELTISDNELLQAVEISTVIGAIAGVQGSFIESVLDGRVSSAEDIKPHVRVKLETMRKRLEYISNL